MQEKIINRLFYREIKKTINQRRLKTKHLSRNNPQSADSAQKIKI
ncbi:hypothetical protein HMPREF1569_1302 [Klebsiella oxytoca OK-1]|nr:hypothetical protein HMPREF1569_1302 [Klebsiella oxytoca OK-1]